MKWSAVILIIFGLIAAVAATILIAAWQAKIDDSLLSNLSAEVQVVRAKRSLSAMSVVTTEDIIEKTVPRENLPEGYLTNSAQVVGKVLALSVVEGQVLTKSCFAAEGSMTELAARIPRGMRAVSIVLSNHAITGGLLYPGCVVDVLASFKLPSRQHGRGEAISRTLLESIQVLAVENTSIVSGEAAKKAYMDEGSSPGKKLTVTLMVSPQQAERLQLAREYGTVSVAMRNPLDRYPIDSEITVLREGQLGQLDSLMTEEQKAELPEEIKNLQEKDTGLQDPGWGVTVIRGQEVTEYEMDIPE